MEALRFRKAKPIYITFFIALAILIFSGVVVIRQLEERAVSIEWVQHSNIVMITIDSFSLNLLEAERQLQFYAITRNKKHWALYNTAITSSKKRWVDLKQLTVDNPIQQNRIKELGTLLNKLIQLSNDKAAHSEKSGWLLLLEQNEKILEQITALINVIRSEEILLHNLRLQKYKSTKYVNNIEIVGTMLLVCLQLLHLSQSLG